MISFSKNNSGIVLQYNSEVLFTRSPMYVKCKEGDNFFSDLAYQSNKLSSSNGYFDFTEKLSLNGKHIIGEVQLSIKTNKGFLIKNSFLFSKTEKAPYFMIPGLLYGSNNLKNFQSTYPKFDYTGKVSWPNSSSFSFRADRSSHPGIIKLANNQMTLIGIDEKMNGYTNKKKENTWSPEHFYNGLFIDSSNLDYDSIGYTFGYENYPKRFSKHTDKFPAPNEDEYLFGYIKDCKGIILTAKTYYIIHKAKLIPDYGNLLKVYYFLIYKPPIKRAQRFDTIKKIQNAIVNYGFNKKEGIFHLTDEQKNHSTSLISRRGGIQTAYPLLKSGLMNENTEAIQTAIECIDKICTNALNSRSGLLFEKYSNGKWQLKGTASINTDEVGKNKALHSSYLNGQAAYYLLLSYELTGKKHVNWFTISEKIIATALKKQRNDGALPASFYPDDGNAAGYDGFQGCWFVPALAKYASLSKDYKIIIQAEKAIDHYFGWHLKGELYGSVVSSNTNINSESNLAFIIACVELHKITGNNRLIDMARIGLDYEFSWKFAYNTSFSNKPLNAINWSSSGGSIQSLKKPYIHTMGNIIAGEMYYLYKKTGDKYIASRLWDTCIWGMGAINCKDKEFGFGKEGMATAAFSFSDISLSNFQGWDGAVYPAFAPWASACILLNCCEDIPDHFFNT